MDKLLMKYIFVIFCAIFFISVVQSNADTIVLKNGNKIEVDHAWEEGELIKGKRPYGVVSFPKDTVETVMYEKETPNESFDFDMWKAGINIEKAFKIAESHDLPLVKTGDLSYKNNFDNKVYKDIKDSNDFHYHTNLMGKYADVSICFTKTSRLLHTVSVSFSGTGVNTPEFKEEILNMLKSKYGNKIKYSTQLFGDTKTWNINNKYTVKIVRLASNIKIEYSDNALSNQNAAEKKKIEDKKRKEYTEKDSSKF